VDEIAIGPKDKVVLLACGERQLLIGVGERGSTVLARSIRPTPRGDQS
jgi:flagellar biogenesis protein FliO